MSPKLRFAKLAVGLWGPAVLAILVASGPAVAQDALERLAQRTAIRHVRVPRKVLAFYYPWYGNAKVAGGSGRWSHWDQVDEANQCIGSSTHYPVLGPYDSHDPKLIAQHCAWAKQSGVDGWIVSWWGKNHFTDLAVRPILEACQRVDMEATIYYEVVPQPVTPETAARDIVDLLRRYGDHPAWLRVGTKPVVFVYGRAVEQLGLLGWGQAASEVQRLYAPGAVLVGDELSPTAALVFDGIHTYNTAGALAGKTLQAVQAWAQTRYPQWVRLADHAVRISTLTLIPGYDDTKIRKPGLAVDRFSGALYQGQWEQALAAAPDWVLITSWNEWHEGSEIEPSVQYGQKYLEITAQYAKPFKRLPPKDKPGAASAAPTIATDPRLARLEGVAVGFLPNPESSALWALLRLPVRPRLLSWTEVAGLKAEAAATLPMLVYAGSEQYCPTANAPNDVDAGLVRYLEGGGLLLVLPAAPMPFYYDDRGRAVNRASQFGLPLSVAGPDGGWESPPKGTRLQFVQPEPRLPHLPARFPFPSEGDLRWRPLVRTRIPPGDRLVPLLELRDDRGNDYGLAAAYIEHPVSRPKRGRVLYAWFGLLQSPEAEAVLADLLAFAAEQIKPQ